MQTQEAQMLLAQAMKAAAGEEGDFTAFWRRLDSEAREFIADTFAKALVMRVGTAAEQRGQDASTVMDEFVRRVSHGGLDLPPRKTGKHASSGS